jgi:hypothetical protein
MKPQQFLIIFLLVGAILIIFASFNIQTDLQTGFHVTQMEIRFNETNATVNIDYEVGFLTQIYVLFFGSRNLDPYLEKFLYGFEEVQLISVSGTTAAVELTNASRITGGYYIHDSRTLGGPVSKLTLVYPDGKTRTFENATETTNTFY